MLTTTTRGGLRLRTRLKALLLNHGSYLPPPSLSSTATTRATVGKIPIELLTDEFLDDIVSRACLVAPTSTPDASATAQETTESATSSSPPYSEADDTALMEQLKSQYRIASTASSLTVPVTPNPPVAGNLKGTILVPGWIRERVADLLFEPSDEEEEQSIQDTILSCILQVSEANSGLHLLI